MKRLIQKALRSQGVVLSRIPKPYPPRREGELGFYDTPIGKYYLPLDTPEDVIAAQMKAGRVFEPEIVEVARRWARPGSTVLDVGANFGQMTLQFSEIVGPDGAVFSFEAQEVVFDILKKNIAVNKADNVTPCFNAVFNETGRVFHFPKPDFAQFGTYGSYSLPLDRTEGAEVTSLMIDDLTFDKPVSFMKVDVQGADLAAMQGAVRTIEKYKMPILFEYEERFQKTFGTSFQDYVDFVRDIGYIFKETVLDINYLIVPRT